MEGGQLGPPHDQGDQRMTTHPPGTPTWVDLGTPDLDMAKRFYAPLFDWTTQVSKQPEAGGYTTFRSGGRAVAAVGPLASEDQPSAWTVYVHTDDADAVADRVETAGGKVLMAPMDVLDYGRMAIFADPAGAVFAVWQPAGMAGAELLDAPGALTWVELITRDVAGSKEFYPAVFGWTAHDSRMGPVDYTRWLLDGRPVAGMMPMTGHGWPADLPPHWMVYFEVTDADATAAKADELGGTVSVPPTDIEPGRFAVLADPAGAFFSILQPAR